jgi:hypothetical protein
MRGDFFHNEVLVRRLKQVAEECGATVSTERPVRIDGSVSYADLVIEKYGEVTVCEPELSWRRVGNDRRKAEALGAHLLLIATPDALTAQACRRQLRRLPRPETRIKVIACPLGAALEILRQTLTAGHRQPASLAPNQTKEI